MKTDNHKVKYATRTFAGHLYYNDKDGNERSKDDVINFFKKCKNIDWLKFQLEKGNEGNLHYQYMFKIKSGERKQRFSYFWKRLDFQTGEWIDGALANGKYMIGYTEKDETKIKGPWEVYLLQERKNDRWIKCKCGGMCKKCENSILKSLLTRKINEIKRLQMLMQQSNEK